MRQVRIARFLFLLFPILVTIAGAQNQPAADPSVPAAPHEKQVHLKHILVISQTKGWEHDSITDAMAAIYNMGHDTGLWDAMLRTDTELITKKKQERNTKN